MELSIYLSRRQFRSERSVVNYDMKLKSRRCFFFISNVATHGSETQRLILLFQHSLRPLPFQGLDLYGVLLLAECREACKDLFEDSIFVRAFLLFLL